MYDGTLEKKRDALKKNLVLNDLLALLLTLTENAAEAFKGAFQDTCFS